MIKFRFSDIYGLFSFLKRKAFAHYECSNYNKSLKYTFLSAIVGYHFNSFYKDDDLDRLLINIGTKAYCPRNIVENKCKNIVLIDSFDSPKVLSVQYIRALISMNIDFLYIVENRSAKMDTYYREIEYSSFGKIAFLKSCDDIEKIQNLCKLLDDYNPSHILTHITPWDTIAVAAISTRSNAIKMNINLTDHAFWLGASIFDYVLEFRAFGASLSFQKRRIDKSKILYNQYYPIVLSNPFEGFPEKTKGKVKIFSGASYDKILGDKGKFLDIMKDILNNNQDTVILYAGMGYGEVYLKRFIKKHKLENRLFLLGERKDIDKVFENCDIFLGTYPFNGGLMTLYSAYYSKPTISYIKEKSVDYIQEDMVFVNTDPLVKCSYDNMDDFLDEMRRLITDSTYRMKQGKLLKDNVMNKEKFDEVFRNNIFNPNSTFRDGLYINYEKISDKYMELYNTNSNIHVNVMLFKFLKLNIFRLNIKFIIDIIYTCLIFLPITIKKKINRFIL